MRTIKTRLDGLTMANYNEKRKLAAKVNSYFLFYLGEDEPVQDIDAVSREQLRKLWNEITWFAAYPEQPYNPYDCTQVAKVNCCVFPEHKAPLQQVKQFCSLIARQA
jgi:hypothetical protein